ncbi:hypothetical protein AB1N83_000606 [Pleurotus pulmonarius]
MIGYQCSNIRTLAFPRYGFAMKRQVTPRCLDVLCRVEWQNATLRIDSQTWRYFRKTKIGQRVGVCRKHIGLAPRVSSTGGCQYCGLLIPAEPVLQIHRDNGSTTCIHSHRGAIP